MFCFFFKQKTAYEMRISDWSSDVCSSDLSDDFMIFLLLLRSTFMFICLVVCSYDGEEWFYGTMNEGPDAIYHDILYDNKNGWLAEIGRASCRERVCQYV